MRKSLSGLGRYIITPEVSKHRIFEFVPSPTIPDASLYVIGVDDGFLYGCLSSNIHVTWALAAGGRMGVGNDPRYQNGPCFDPFPFPDPSPAQRAPIADLAEQLDAHRKRQQAAHPDLTMTGMYNVLAKLRSGAPLDAKEKKIHEQGLVSILRHIHDDLDAAVADAYGWPHDLDEAGILERLVALNHERAEEERRGHVRWLRPEYQAPETSPATATLLPLESDETEAEAEGAKSKKARRLAWPKALPDQLAAVRTELASLPQPFAAADVASRFTSASRDDIAAALGCLAALGLVLRLGEEAGDERYGTVETRASATERPKRPTRAPAPA